jgi:hypothetical protein
VSGVGDLGGRDPPDPAGPIPAHSAIRWAWERQPTPGDRSEQTVSKRKRGDGYEVRWTEGGRKRSRSFARSSDADAFETEIRRRKQLGPLAPSIIQSTLTLAEFMEDEWWPRYAIPNLDEDTRRRYLEVWGKDLLPRVGAYKLREITPLVVEDVRDQLIKRGLAIASVLKALHLLSAILKRAAVRGLIPANPVDMVAKPSPPPAAPPRPLTPLTIEKIRAVMLKPKTKTVSASPPDKRVRRAYEAHTGSPTERQRNALIVSMLAYGGFRPIEDRNAEWRDLHKDAMRVYATKTRRERYVDLLAPLAEWRVASGLQGCNRWADHPATVGRFLEPRGLGQLAAACVPAGGARRRRYGRPAPVPAARFVRVSIAVVGRGSRVCRRSGRPLGRDAGAPLRRCHPRASRRPEGARRGAD